MCGAAAREGQGPGTAKLRYSFLPSFLPSEVPPSDTATGQVKLHGADLTPSSRYIQGGAFGVRPEGVRGWATLKLQTVRSLGFPRAATSPSGTPPDTSRGHLHLPEETPGISSQPLVHQRVGPGPCEPVGTQTQRVRGLQASQTQLQAWQRKSGSASMELSGAGRRAEVKKADAALPFCFPGPQESLGRGPCGCLGAVP